MGRRGEKPIPEQPSGAWVQASLDRLQKHRETRRDASSGVTEETFLQLGSRPRKAIAAGELVAPAAEPTEYRTIEEVMAMVHRGGVEGLRPSGFLQIGTLCTFVGDPCRFSRNLMKASLCHPVSPLARCGCMVDRGDEAASV